MRFKRIQNILVINAVEILLYLLALSFLNQFGYLYYYLSLFPPTQFRRKILFRPLLFIT